MEDINKLLEIIPEKLFTDLIKYKKNNIERRANGNESILRNLNSLDSYYNKVIYIDELIKQIKDIISNYNIELDNVSFNEYKTILQEYNSLVNILNSFKEEEPGINEIFSSSQWRTFNSRFSDWEKTQYNNQSKLTILKVNLERLLNNLKIKKIELASNIDEKLINEIKKIDLKKIEKAEEIAKTLLEKKDKNIHNEITEQYEFFEQEAKRNMGVNLEKNLKGIKFIQYFYPINYISFKIIWLLLSILTGILIGFYIYFIFQDKNLTIGDSLLRISILTIAFYFIIFFSKQYSYHKNLEKSYTFKAISLKTMLGLSKISSDSEKTMIYEKALDKIFSEPNSNFNNRDSGDIINIIKDSIPTTKIQTSFKET